MKARHLFTALFLVSVFFMQQSVAVAEKTQEITVSAAISLKDAFEEIAKLYETKHKGAKVSCNFGASGDLMRQIEGGAPVDVFASAAQKDMDEADRRGFLVSGSRAVFAANTVVLVTSSARAPIKSFEDLNANRVRKIGVGNPKTVPAGRYAEEVFVHYKMFDAIRDKLVLTENVRQVLDYVVRGEVDAGVVYETDAMTRPKEVSIVATAPEHSHKPVVYPVAVVKGTRNEATAKDFIALVLSPEGRSILAKYGFRKP